MKVFLKSLNVMKRGVLQRTDQLVVLNFLQQNLCQVLLVCKSSLDNIGQWLKRLTGLLYDILPQIYLRVQNSQSNLEDALSEELTGVVGLN